MAVGKAHRKQPGELNYGRSVGPTVLIVAFNPLLGGPAHAGWQNGALQQAVQGAAQELLNGAPSDIQQQAVPQQLARQWREPQKAAPPSNTVDVPGPVDRAQLAAAEPFPINAQDTLKGPAILSGPTNLATCRPQSFRLAWVPSQ